jgi:hypothetical protein
MVRHGGYAAIVVGASLGIGVAGYHWLAGFGWVDSLLNASMLLGGMGPVGDLPNDAAKLFASLFAFYSGVIFLVLAALAARASVPPFCTDSISKPIASVTDS